MGQPIISSKKTILVVDDTEEFRGFLRELLIHGGYDVVEAENGKKAMNAISLQTPDLLVTDIFMPDGDGIELINTLRVQGMDFPVIALSGGNPGAGYDVSYIEIAKRLGADFGFCKPIDTTVFKSIVASLLDVGAHAKAAMSSNQPSPRRM